MPAQDVGTGTSIAFGTSNFQADVLSIGQGDSARASIDTTKMATTGRRTSMPADLVKEGDITVQCAFDPDLQPPIDQPPETITITFPVPSGKSTGAKVAGTGFVKAWSWDDPLEDKMVMTFVIEWDGETGPTWTDSAV